MYHLNPQSNEYGKALLSPTKAEVCTEDGIRALKIDIANYAGKDKLTWQERVDWFKCPGRQNSPNGWRWKKEILGRKAVKAYNDAQYGNKPIAHFVELDATSSGYQLMACLSQCTKTASICNLTNTGKREDLYQIVLDELNQRTGKNYTRKEAKKAIMTSSYNSKAKPKEIFGEDVDMFWNVMHDLCPGAMDVMEVINGCWNPNALEHSWIMPDGHIVKVPVTEIVDHRIMIRELDDRRITVRYKKNMPSENGRSLVPNVIHATDSFVLREVVRRCDYNKGCIELTDRLLSEELQRRGLINDTI